MVDALIATSRILGSESAESAGGIASLGVDLKGLLLQIVTFLIVFFLLKRFALDKIVATLEKRHQTINDGVRIGQEMAAQKAELDSKITKALHKARVEADRIIASGHQEAHDLLKEAEEAAVKKTEIMLTDARLNIEEDLKKRLKQLEKDTLQLVASATETLIAQKLDADEDQHLIRAALDEARLP